jgi:uncharacterized protein (TIGR02147 family)
MEKNQDIYEYSCFRKFLKDYYDQEKRKSPRRFSYRYLSRKLGYSSPSYLLFVMNGKKNLSYKGVQRLCQWLGFSKRQHHFFEALVHFNQTKDPEDKAQAFERMISFKEYREARKLTTEQYEFMSRWYYSVIRELVAFKDFQEDPTWICKKLNSRIGPVEVTQALDVLLKLGLIERGTDGKLKQYDINIATEEELVSTALMKFHNQMIDKGKESLKHPSDQREVSSLTLGMSLEQFQHIKGKVKEFHRDVLQYLEKNSDHVPSTVYQLNFQLFDLLGPKKETLS